MSELDKGRSATIEKEEFSAQDAKKIVKSVMGDDAFVRPDQFGSVDTTKKDYADYEDAQKLPENLRSLWWRIENARAQIMELAEKFSKQKNSIKLTAEKLDAVNNELDDLARQSGNLSEIQGIVVGEKDPDKIIIALDDLINDYECNLNDEDFLKESGEENIEKVSKSLKASISELTNYKHHIKFITSNNNANFMPESTSKEISPIINIQKNNEGKEVGRIADDELAHEMANKVNKMHKEWKKEIKDASNKEINEAIETAADRAMEDVFKSETGMEYEAAVQEAKEELKGTEDRIEKEINDDKKVIQNQAAGIKDEEVKEIIINDDKEAGQNLKDKTTNSKSNAEIKIGEIEAEPPSKEPIQGEVKEIKDEKIEAAKKDFENKIKNIDGKIKILENSHGNPGDRRLYIAREAGVDIKQLMPNEEGRQKLIILARHRAEKAELQKVEEIANNPEIKNYDELQDRLWDNYKSAMRECDKKGKELDKEPKGSDRRKKLVEEIRDLQAKKQMARDSMADFDNRAAKEREEKDKRRQMRNQKAVKSEPVGKPQESRVDEPKIDAKPADVQMDSQPNRNERDEIIAAYDRRIENLRLGADEARQAMNENRAKELEKYARDAESEKKWHLKQLSIKNQTKKTDNKKQKLSEPVGEPAASVDAQEEAERIKNGKKAKKSEEKESGEKKEEPKEKTAEEILREKNIEAYGGAEKLNQIFEDYKRLNELEDKKAYYEDHPLFREWDALRVKLANINLEILSKDRTIDLYKIQNKDEKIREYFNTKLDESLEAFQKDIQKASPAELAIRAATLIKYRNELKNCDWQGKDKYRDIPRKDYLETMKVLEQKIDILNEMLPKKEGASPEAALKDMSIDDFKKIEKEPEYKGGYPAVIEAGPKVELTNEQTARVERILKDFDLTAEDAEKIEGFKDLSYGQRLLALENLRQLTLRDVRIGSVKKQKEEAGQAQGFWKKLWTGIKKKYDIAKHEKSISQSLDKEDNLATLTQLTRGIREFKTDVLEKDGKLEFQYISGLENLTPEQATKVQKFNEVASELSKMPMEWTADDSKKGFFRQMMDKAGLGQSWSPDDPTRGQYNRCQELTAEFQSLKQEVMQVVKQQKDADLKKGGIEKFDDWENQSHAMAQMLQMENLLRYNRAMNTNPDAEKALMEIKSAPLWKRALNNIATEKGIYFAAGLAARSVGIMAMGSIGVIGGATVIGGAMGYKRGKEFLHEQDTLAQHKAFLEEKEKGVKWEKTKERQVAIQDKMRDSDKYRGKELEGELLKEFIKDCRKVMEAEQGKEKKIEKKTEDANVLASNLEKFVDYINKEREKGSGRENDLAKRLRDRVKYVKTALDEGRINFGAADTRVASLYELTDKLNDAVVCVEDYNKSTRHEADQWSEANQSKVMEKLNEYLNESKMKLSKERRKYLRLQLAKGAAYGFGFASAGTIVREVCAHLDPHIINQQGEWDIGVRWISGSDSSKPLAGGIVGKYMHGEPGGGGGGYESGKGPEMFPEEKYFGGEANPEKVKNLIDQFNKDFRYHPEWKSNLLEQGKALEDLTRQLEAAGIKDDALKEIIDSAKDQLNGDGDVFIVKGGSQEAQNLAGIESTGGSGGGSTAEQTATAAGAGKSVDAVVGAKTEAAQFINEIKNVGGIKHDSIWRSTHELIREHAKEMGMEYPGKSGTKLSEVEWYNLKTSQLVNELDKNTTGGIKDLVYEGNKVVAEKGSGGNWRINIEQSSGFKPGRLADLHHNVAGVKAPAIGNASSVPESAPIHPEPIWEPMINEPQATDHPWDNWPKQAAGNPIDDIFNYPFGRQGAETMTYQNVKNEIAENFMRRNLSREVDINDPFAIDSDDARRYGELQNYINDMAKKPGNYPHAGETVDQFIQRMNRNIVMTPEHAVTDAAPGKTMPPHESSQKLEIDKEFFKENQASMPEINTPNNIHIGNDKLVADIEFKYNSSGQPVEILVPKIQAGARIDPMSYLDRSNLQSFDARVEGVRLSTYMEIYNELKAEEMSAESGVVAEKIKEIIGGIEKTRHGIIDYSKLPQEIREKLEK